MTEDTLYSVLPLVFEWARETIVTNRDEEDCEDADTTAEPRDLLSQSKLVCRKWKAASHHAYFDVNPLHLEQGHDLYKLLVHDRHFLGQVAHISFDRFTWCRKFCLNEILTLLAVCHSVRTVELGFECMCPLTLSVEINLPSIQSVKVRFGLDHGGIKENFIRLLHCVPNLRTLELHGYDTSLASKYPVVAQSPARLNSLNRLVKCGVTFRAWPDDSIDSVISTDSLVHVKELETDSTLWITSAAAEPALSISLERLKLQDRLHPEPEAGINLVHLTRLNSLREIDLSDFTGPKWFLEHLQQLPAQVIQVIVSGRIMTVKDVATIEGYNWASLKGKNLKRVRIQGCRVRLPPRYADDTRSIEGHAKGRRAREVIAEQFSKHNVEVVVTFDPSLEK